MVVVPGHGGEQVVLQLRVHAAPDPGFERAEHRVRVAGGSELTLHVLRTLAVLHDLLALVRRRHQARDDEPGEKDAADGNLPGHARREPEVVDAEEHELLLVLALPRALDAVEPPEPEHDRQEGVPVDVLVLPQGVVGAARLAGGPQEEEGLHHHVVVEVLLVGERVVHGVLLRPPLDRMPVEQRGHVPQRVAQGTAAVHVVVAQPARLHHTEAEQQGREPRVGVREELTGGVQTGHLDERPRLLEHVALEEAVRLELTPELAEVHGRRVLARGRSLVLLLGGSVALGELGEPVGGLAAAVGPVGVEGVEGVGGVAAVEEPYPALTAGVSLGPSACVVPLIVDLDAHGLTLGLVVGGHRVRGAQRVGSSHAHGLGLRLLLGGLGVIGDGSADGRAGGHLGLGPEGDAGLDARRRGGAAHGHARGERLVGRAKRGHGVLVRGDRVVIRAK